MHFHGNYTHYPQPATSCVKPFLLKNFAIFGVNHLLFGNGRAD